MAVHYQNVDEIEAVVRGFEECSTGKDAFTHAGHLTVAAWYLNNYPPEQAAARMRTGLFRFLDHHSVGPEKYNETITMFWLKVVNDFMIAEEGSSRDMTKGQELAAMQFVFLANELVQTFGDARLIFDYYSESLIRSPEAKSAWLDPDLKQL
ncbi:MAG: hypothetical protein ABJC05_01830 [Pyrinomonadaceae bacterium]